MEKCCEGELWRSVVAVFCGEVLRWSVVAKCCAAWVVENGL